MGAIPKRIVPNWNKEEQVGIRRNRKDSRAIQSGKRFLYTSGSMGVDAKNRFDLPPEIPADWNGYQKLINDFWSGTTQKNSELKG